MNKTIYVLILLLGFGIYSVNSQSLTTSNLPILKVNTQGKSIVDEPKILSTLELIHKGNGLLNNINDPANIYKGFVGIELRGSSSKDLFPKKPYGFETWKDSLGNDQKVSLLDMPAEADWVLNATYNDKTLMRDVLTYDLVNKMGRYATRTRYCEMVLNNDYQGLYILMEKIKRDKNRVDISSLKTTDNTGEDVTGGYILKIDKTSGSPSKNWTNNTNTPFGNYKTLFQVEYPKITDITQSQFEYIQKYVNDFEVALLSPDFQSPQAKWREMCDLDTFIDYFLITEFVKNVDGYRLSTFFYKEKSSKGGKLKMGPAWDYNLAFGNADYYDGYKSTGWQYKINDIALPKGDIYPAPFWWQQLAQDSIFKTKTVKRWEVLRKTTFNPDNINKWIDSTATVLEPAMKRNFTKWSVLGKYVWPNYYVGSTFQDETNWLKEWIRTRTLWLDSQFQTFALTLGNEDFLEKEKPIKVFPNPVESETTLEYQVFKKGNVSIILHDINGKAIKTLVDEFQNTDTYQIPLNLGNLNTGSYIINYQLDGIPIERVKLFKK
ncbi:CotH kinase family protein [Arcicella sp. DC2W]|uniref:CotH kinase family protein n=1 Tax=Arcicella gelida TaxID=2984195 RepID=A0ABU5S3T5_9BACT|nr:CotH kinase family protein [Arcicella sp. DC2W]MEA5403159.1 CotH kinase family protein [Arcicella sp. DC2W]